MTDTENDLNAPSTHHELEKLAATTAADTDAQGDTADTQPDSTANAGNASATHSGIGESSSGQSSTGDSTIEGEPATVPASVDGDGSTDASTLADGEAGKPDDDSDDGDDSDDDDSDDNPLETEGEIAADYLEELLDIADLDGDIDTYIEGDRAHVSIVSESDVLVGSDGHVLDALQELARLAVMTETGDRSRLMLDVAGYRDRRRKELVAVAADAVEEAKSSNDSVALAPMNPFERKIVHDAVAAAGLTSASEGEEPRRRVVVRPTA